MLRNFLEHELIFKEYPNKVSSSESNSSSKLHQCALSWSDRCAHCESGFDDLKQKVSSSNEPSEENLNDLRKQIEESLAKLEGVFI
jgi:hypothetical protein